MLFRSLLFLSVLFVCYFICIERKIKTILSSFYIYFLACEKKGSYHFHLILKLKYKVTVIEFTTCLK